MCQGLKLGYDGGGMWRESLVHYIRSLSILIENPLSVRSCVIRVVEENWTN